MIPLASVNALAVTTSLTQFGDMIDAKKPNSIRKHISFELRLAHSARYFQISAVMSSIEFPDGSRT
jgi:hypothetical protein